MELSGGGIVIKALTDMGVEVVFGYPGGAVLPIYDALFQQNELRHILVRHEQAAVHAAEGYARSTGGVGVVLVTSGPGATNAVTGLTDALMDSVPVVCLTGQVPTHMIGNDAFQEADTVGITRPCTKHNYLVKDVAELATTMARAFYVARTGRPGPVVVDLPKDVLVATIDYEPVGDVIHDSYRPRTEPEPDAIEKAARVLCRRWGGQLGRPRQPVVGRIRQDDRVPGHVHVDGAGWLSARRPKISRHARHARHLRGQHGDA